MEIIKIDTNEKIKVKDACKQLFQLGICSEEIEYLMTLEYSKDEALHTLKQWVEIELKKQLDLLGRYVNNSCYQIEHSTYMKEIPDIVKYSTSINRLNNIWLSLNCEDMW